MHNAGSFCVSRIDLRSAEPGIPLAMCFWSQAFHTPTTCGSCFRGLCVILAPLSYQRSSRFSPLRPSSLENGLSRRIQAQSSYDNQGRMPGRAHSDGAWLYRSSWWGAFLSTGYVAPGPASEPQRNVRDWVDTLGQDFTNNTAVYIGQAEFPTSVLKGQAFVI
jgi:hypothetical protein